MVNAKMTCNYRMNSGKLKLQKKKHCRKLEDNTNHAVLTQADRNNQQMQA